LIFEASDAGGDVGIPLFGEHLFASKLSSQYPEVDDSPVQRRNLHVELVEGACKEIQAMVDDVESAQYFCTELQDELVLPIEPGVNGVEATIDGIQAMIDGIQAMIDGIQAMIDGIQAMICLLYTSRCV